MRVLLNLPTALPAQSFGISSLKFTTFRGRDAGWKTRHEPEELNLHYTAMLTKNRVLLRKSTEKFSTGFSKYIKMSGMMTESFFEKT